MPDPHSDGWGTLNPISPGGDAEAIQRIQRAFARCFSGADGDLVLSHLRALTLDRALGPAVSDQALRHLNGQRCLVLHIQSLIDRGHGCP